MVSIASQRILQSLPYIIDRDPATSVQRVSISSLSVCSAKTLSSGSSSDKNPRIPEADVKPGMLTAGVLCEEIAESTAL